MECYCSFLLTNGKINILMPSPSQLKSACPFSLSLVNIWMFIFNVLSLITGASRCEERTWIVWMLSDHPSPPHGLQGLPAVRNIFILICKPDFFIFANCEYFLIYLQTLNIFNFASCEKYSLIWPLFQIFLRPSKTSHKGEFKRPKRSKGSSALQPENLSTW